MKKSQLRKIIREEILREGITSDSKLEKSLRGYEASIVIGSLIYALKKSNNDIYEGEAFDSLYDCYDRLKREETEFKNWKLKNQN